MDKCDSEPTNKYFSIQQGMNAKHYFQSGSLKHQGIMSTIKGVQHVSDRMSYRVYIYILTKKKQIYIYIYILTKKKLEEASCPERARSN